MKHFTTKTRLARAAMTLLVALLTPLAMNAEETLTVHDGSATNTNVPIWGLWADNSLKSEMVYPATELEDMSGGIISVLAIHSNGTSNISSTGSSNSSWNGTCQIFMKEVSETTISDFTGTYGAIVVYDGPISLVNGVMTIELSTPYTYGGGNLLVGYYYTSGGAYASVTWKGESVSNAAVYGRSGNSYTVNAASFLPKTTFTYTPGSGVVYKKPTNLTVSDLTSNGATISWTAPEGSPTGYAYQYKKSADEEWSALATTTETSVSISGLATATAYNFRVKAVYGADGESGFVSKNFTTFCAAYDIPYTYGFEEAAPFDCWTVISGNVSRQSGTTNSDSYRLDFRGTTSNMIALPQFTDPTNTLRVEFYTRPESTGGSSGKFAIGYMTDITDASTFVAVETYNSTEMTTTYVKKTVDFVDTPANAIIAMRQFDCQTNYYWYVDDVTVKAIPSCFAPTALNAGNIATTSADLSWTSNAGTFTVYYKKSTDDTYTEVPDVTNPYTLEGLDPSTYYQFYVVANCSASDSSEPSEVFTFSTAINSYPWTENFDGISVALASTSSRTLPVSWNYINECTNNSYKNYPTIYNSSNYANSTPNSLRFYSFYSNSTNSDPQPQYAILPPMTNLADKQVRLNARGYNTSSTFKIGTMGDPTDASTFTLIAEQDGLTTSYPEVPFEYLIPATCTDSYLAIMIDAASSNRTSNGVYIDDIEIREAPTCLRPTDLAVTATTATSATLSWTNGTEGQTAWQICINGDEEHLIDANSNPFTIGNLTAATSYTAKVRACCSETDQSEWSKTLSFTTQCEANTIYPWTEYFDEYTAGTGVLPDCWSRINTSTNSSYSSYPDLINSSAHSGSNCLRLYSYAYYNNGSTTSDPQPQYAILPPMENLAGKLITLYAKGENATSTFKIGTMSNPLNPGTFTMIAEQTLTTSYPEDPFEYLIPADCTDSYVAVMIDAATSSRTTNGVYIDDIVIHNAPTCLKPTDLEVTATTTNSATISWTNGAEDQTAWQICINGNETEPISANSNPFTVEGLTPGTPYTAKVRAYCSADDQSDWSKEINFTTECETITITESNTYIQGFEDYTGVVYNANNGVVPVCWDSYSTGSVAPHIIGSGSYYYVHEGTQALTFFGLGYCYAALPEFTNALSQLQISFWMWTESSSNGELTLGYITAEDENFNTFTAIETYGRNNGSMVQRLTYLNEVPAAATQLVFRWFYSTQYSCCIDDVEVSLIPSCVSPTGLTASDVTSTSATLSWTEHGSATAWVLQYGTDETFTAGTYTETTVSTNPTTSLTGLTSESIYYARVKPACDTEGSNWSNVVEFVPTNFVDYTYNEGATSDNSYYPFSGSYTNSATNQSQFVIPAEELAEIAGGTIRSITYYASSTSITTADWGGVIFDVYMAEVENSTFSNATFIDWETLNNVYTGTVSLSNGMMTIAFDQNYTYNGGNLLIGFKTNTAGTETQSVSWRGTYGSQYHVLYQYGSNSASRTSFFPKITFSYQPTPYKYPVIDEANCTYTTTSAHIAWTVTGATPTGYQYQFKTISGEWPANWSSTTDAYADLSNLTHSTVYDFRVKALYDGGHESIVVNYRFATECDVITTFPVTYGFETTEGFPANASTSTTNLLGDCWRNEATVQTGSNATRVWGTSTNYHHDGSQALILPDKGSSSSTETDCAKTMLVFPAMNFTAPSGYIVSFWINRNGTNNNPEGFKMYISDCDYIGPNAVELGHYSRNYGQPYPVAESGGGWYQYQTAPITMTGTVYLIFEGHSYYGSSTYVDDITIDVTPTCWQPQDLAASNVTNEAATITWTAGGSETEWQIEYATDANFTNPLYATVDDDPTYTFHGLADGTNYYVHVQAVCGGTDGSSKYSDYLSFSTLQTAVNLPYVTDFESGNDWLFVNGGLTNAWAYGTATSNGEGHALYISTDGGTTNAYDNHSTMVYATKTFNFNAGTYVFSYDWKANGESTYDYLRVALVPSSVTLTAGTNVPSGFNSSSLPTGWIALDGGEKLNLKSEWQSFKSNEIQVAAGTYMMVFAWRNDGITNNNPPAAIDNVSIETVTCPAPTGLACNPASITANSVELSWTENGEANAWEIELTYEEDEDDNTEIITADSTPFTLTNLNSDTEYTVRVRAYYDADHQSRWSEKVDFETASECQTPDGLAATATTTSADISWNGYGQANFNLRYSTDGENWTTIPENVTNPYTLTQLTPATTYYVQVQPTCADVETWSAQYSFTTDCDVITIAQGSAYTYDFENPTPWICWTNIAGSNVRSSGSNNTTDGNYKLQFKGTTTGNIVAMPTFTPDINGLMLTFWTRPEGYTYSSCGTFSVGYMTDLADASTFVPVATYDRSDWTSNTYAEMNVIFTSAPAGAYIAFCHNALATNYYWYVDDVKVSITPTCWQPQNLAASNVTNEAATLTWERHPYGDETAWVLQYGTDDTFATCTEVNVDTNPIYEISGGLASETTYYARVKPACDTEGDLWSEVESFTTLSNCTVPNGLSTTDITLNSAKLNWTGLQGNYNVRYRKVFTPKVDFDETYGFEDGTLQGWTSYDEDGDGQGWSNSSNNSHGGSKCVSAIYNETNVPNNWLISPEIPLGGTISFYAMRFGAGTGEQFQVFVSTTGTDISDFTAISDVIDATNAHVLYEYDLSSYSGNGYVAIKHTAAKNQYYLYVDDITISCHISEEYGEWVNKSDVTSGLTIDGLEMNTMYEWQVQGICSECEGGATDWSAMDPFTTLPLLDITLVDDETDNASTIGANPGAYANVTLSGRTLYKDGYWNTLCLPFSLDADETAASPLAGANMMTLNTSASGFEDGTLTLNFAEATSIDAGKPYIVKWGKPADFVINSADDWDTFCAALQDNDTYNRFSGKTVVLGNDISVSSRAGSEGHEFMGTFDGQGHTLTVSYGTADSPINEQYATPFRYVDGCKIKNLRVDGTIISNTKRVAGVIGETGSTTSHITNCVSSAIIKGTDYTGGFSIGGNVEIESCVFNGKINGSSQSGGFVGYSKPTLTISNSLFDPQSGSTITGGTFYYNGGGEITPTNSYYTQAVGTAQGTDATSMSNAQLLNALGSGWQEKDGKVVPVMSTDRIFEPVFTNVIIDATMNDVETSDGKATFKGTYDKIPFTSDNRSILFLGANNTLYWPESGASIGACRAYFELNGLTAGDIAAARLFFGDEEGEAQGIRDNKRETINNKHGDALYTLNGVKVEKPMRKGLYIQNGRKVAIK